MTCSVGSMVHVLSWHSNQPCRFPQKKMDSFVFIPRGSASDPQKFEGYYCYSMVSELEIATRIAASFPILRLKAATTSQI